MLLRRIKYTIYEFGHFQKIHLEMTGNALLKISVHALFLLPVIILLYDFYANQLTAEPVQEAMHRTGKYTLISLLITLSCTPLNKITGLRKFAEWRRTAGLYSFFFGSLHGFIFFIVDYGMDPEFIREALFEKPYALMGFSAYVLLIPLALTSNRFSMQKLRKNWKKLHRLIYISVFAGIVHYIWLVKSDYRIPLLYGAVFAILMGSRVFQYAKKV